MPHARHVALAPAMMCRCSLLVCLSAQILSSRARQARVAPSRPSTAKAMQCDRSLYLSVRLSAMPRGGAPDVSLSLGDSAGGLTLGPPFPPPSLSSFLLLKPRYPSRPRPALDSDGTEYNKGPPWCHRRHGGVQQRMYSADRGRDRPVFSRTSGPRPLCESPPPRDRLRERTPCRTPT